MQNNRFFRSRQWKPRSIRSHVTGYGRLWLNRKTDLFILHRAIPVTSKQPRDKPAKGKFTSSRNDRDFKTAVGQARKRENLKNRF